MKVPNDKSLEQRTQRLPRLSKGTSRKPKGSWSNPSRKERLVAKEGRKWRTKGAPRVEDHRVHSQRHSWVPFCMRSRYVGPRISTIDLAGKTTFTIFTGIGGENWKRAFVWVERALGVTVLAYSIGFRQDYEVSYMDWARIRGFQETWCVLVRPDRFVAWRSNEALQMDLECMVKLRQVLVQILG